MSDAWERTKAQVDKHAQASGIFVRLANDGDKVVGAFCGAPHVREVAWTGSQFEPFDPDKHKKCSQRVMINFYLASEGKMKIIEGGPAWFADVYQLRAKYGTDNWLFEITRHGASGSPRTSYAILPERQIDPDLRARIAAAELHDLANIGASEEEDNETETSAQPAPRAASAGSTSAPSGSVVAPSTIDMDVALELIERLKALPRADADAFLKTLGAQRVRAIRASDEGKARALLAELEVKHAPQQAEDVADPFA
jgi:hypothetical protein